MAFRKTDKTTKSVASKAVVSKSTPVAVTPVRNSAIPPKAAATPAKKPVVTHEMISVRAYEIWRVTGNSAESNWTQAEKELKGI